MLFILSLPDHLIVAVIKKMYKEDFLRFRRSSKSIHEFAFVYKNHFCFPHSSPVLKIIYKPSNTGCIFFNFGNYREDSDMVTHVENHSDLTCFVFNTVKLILERFDYYSEEDWESATSALRSVGKIIRCKEICICGSFELAPRIVPLFPFTYSISTVAMYPDPSKWAVKRNSFVTLAEEVLDIVIDPNMQKLRCLDILIDGSIGSIITFLFKRYEKLKIVEAMMGPQLQSDTCTYVQCLLKEIANGEYNNVRKSVNMTYVVKSAQRMHKHVVNVFPEFENLHYTPLWNCQRPGPYMLWDKCTKAILLQSQNCFVFLSLTNYPPDLQSAYSQVHLNMKVRPSFSPDEVTMFIVHGAFRQLPVDASMLLTMIEKCDFEAARDVLEIMGRRVKRNFYD